MNGVPPRPGSCTGPCRSPVRWKGKSAGDVEYAEIFGGVALVGQHVHHEREVDGRVHTEAESADGHADQETAEVAVLATALLSGLAGGERFAGRAHRLQEVAAVIGRTGCRLVSTRNPDGTIRFLNPSITPGGTFLSGAAWRAQASSYMRGGEHRQVTLDLAPDVAQGDAEHSLVTVERVHLYALGAAIIRVWMPCAPRR
jgi:hypothetical protein